MMFCGETGFNLLSQSPNHTLAASWQQKLIAMIPTVFIVGIQYTSQFPENERTNHVVEYHKRQR